MGNKVSSRDRGEADGQGQVRGEAREQRSRGPSSPRGAETRSRPQAGPRGAPTPAGAAARPHCAPQDPPGARPAGSPPARRGAGCRRGGGAPLPGAPGQVGSITWKQSHILAAGRCGPAAARRVQAQVPAPARGRPGGRARAALCLRSPALQLAAGSRLRAVQATPSPATARTPPRPAQPAPSRRGASAGGAAVLIQPIGCGPQGPALLAAPPRPRPAGNQSETGPAPLRSRPAPPPRSGPAGFPPPGRHPAPAALRPSPALSLAPPRALKGPFKSVDFGRLPARGPGTLRQTPGLDLLPAVLSPSLGTDMAVTRWGAGHPGRGPRGSRGPGRPWPAT